MSITKENYRNFYFGSAAELYIQSEFYTFGFEAYKAQPDIGFDICVTNNALAKFQDCEKKLFNVQVKARLVNTEKTSFLVSAEDFEMLLNDESSVLILVLGFPEIAPDWNTFDYFNYRESTLMVINSLDWNAMQYSFEEDAGLAVNEAEDKYNIVGYKKIYCWLNNMHLKRLLSEEYFVDYEYNKKKYKQIKIRVEKKQTLSFYRDTEESATDIASELQSVKYLVDKRVSCRRDLDRGMLFAIDAFDGSI